MQSDDELQTTLSKWPFFLGDVLLVATALSIAILGEWELTNWQVASCVFSVALGCFLFTLPYIVEYRVRIREEAEDHNAELLSLQRQLGRAEESLQIVSERIESVEAGMGHSVQAKLEAEAIESLQSELAALQIKIDELPASAWEISPTDAPRQEVQSEDSKLENAVTTVSPIAKKTREPRKRRTAEAQLLKRAIYQKQDKSSAAVSRIIESKPKQQIGQVEASDDITHYSQEASDHMPEPMAELVIESSKPKDPSPPSVQSRARIKKNDTAVIASVFIGIGNKPYIRGSGAGLNWESGVAMEFEEIGKWRWIALEDLKVPVEIQLYRNDKEPDSTGKYTLKPGQKLKLSPVF